MNNITFVIFTFNEGKRIERVIKNFINYGKILIADNKSTDNTCEIALSYGCEIFVREKHYDYVENQELVDQLYNAITTDWIYWGFADEMLENSTLNKLVEATKSGDFDIISIDRKNYFYGEFCNNLYHAHNYKAFKKYALDFTDNAIHSTGKAMVPENRVYKMPDQYFIHHFISNTAFSYLNVINRYTEKEVEFGYKPKVSLWYFTLLVLKHLSIGIFTKSTTKMGFSRVALIELMLFYTLVKNMKIYENTNGLTTLSIEEKNDIYRDKILNNKV
ncbi:glycosyltransferase [Mucilaginibacter pallidiroseus]|uniref:Glycosyltransferase n=1 Tax=Mucilaginibacter pallidiroseus TaxID=2599295 RepID=A0A563UII7_9SPHI|nr:glycosyltransferase [Mucilaginibacter pallidiroseus]TWR31175.1 glycosyltransferase [Mucilaginibacter pallidiroseus]